MVETVGDDPVVVSPSPLEVVRDPDVHIPPSRRPTYLEPATYTALEILTMEMNSHRCDSTWHLGDILMTVRSWVRHSSRFEALKAETQALRANMAWVVQENAQVPSQGVTEDIDSSFG
ncbi:hypothetical protein BWQ96_04678 [Gracilariopsis chorda]|uniref:Uncharacterized protein n=1 Tax=Gracilariopsis chorda TaxID=448386 RepID=A0A2V3IWM4_9FLOR|nr:hypothetical protein BWQ96_04678 [Gracilariopsis chorda]|eukprot:PXF45540.1 hypothetical protein BWQ96_04678 [Gracilariopsis chorda]